MARLARRRTSPSFRWVPILPGKISVKGGACAIAAGDVPSGAPLTVSFHGDRMPGAGGPPRLALASAVTGGA
jgi:hypothetical protein